MRKKGKKSKTEKQRSPIAEPGPSIGPGSFFWGDAWIQAAFLFVLVAAVYLPALQVPWYLDDYSSILDNRFIRSWSGIRYIVEDNFMFRSVVLLSYALDWAVTHQLNLYEAGTAAGTPGRPSPLVFHISSFIYHFIAVWGVFLLARKVKNLLTDNMSAPDGDSADKTNTYSFSLFFPFAAALFFGLQPINTEAVTYLSGRASVLAAIQYIYGVWAFLFAAEKFGVFEETVRPSSRRNSILGGAALGTALFLFILGIGTKEIIITMPAVATIWIGLVLWQRFPIKCVLKRLAPVLAAGALLFVIFAIYRISVLGSLIGFKDAQVRPWNVNLISQVAIISSYYLPRQFGIGTLCLDPELPTIVSFGDPAFLGGALILGAILVVAFISCKRAPLITLGLIWYLIAISPTSSIIPLNDLAAERRTYLPNAGFSMAVCAGVVYLYTYAAVRFVCPKKILHAGLAVFLVVFYGFLTLGTLQRNRLYTDKEAFWLEAIAQAQVKDRVFYNLGHYYLQNGESEKAIDAFQKTIDRNGFYAVKAANNLAILYMQDLKDYERAAEMFAKCIQLQPEREIYWSNLGTCYLLLRDFERADVLAETWLKRSPKSYYAGRFAAQNLHAQQRLDEAEALYLKLMEQHGRRESLLKNLSNIARVKGDDAAFKRYQRLLSLIQKNKAYRSPESQGDVQSFRLEAE